MLRTVSVPCKPSWKNRRRSWLRGWRASSCPKATLPLYLDNNGRHVVCLATPGPLVDLVHDIRNAHEELDQHQALLGRRAANGP